MSVSAEADAAAVAFIRARSLLSGVDPEGFVDVGAHGSHLVVTRIPLPTFNGVFTVARAGDEAEIRRFAAAMAGIDLPWSMQVRGGPAAGIHAIAAEHGLTRLLRQPVMARPLDRTGLPGAAQSPLAIRRVGPADRPAYIEVLGSGFGLPESIGAKVAGEALFEASWATCYLAEADGAAVGVGLSVHTGDHLGVFNIATAPPYRRRGVSRALTARILSDGAARGARSAYVQPSPVAFPLYTSLGFRVVDTWTYLHGTLRGAAALADVPGA